ncbi:hypothetical protein CVV68_03725 [Arthrobacter livingstonensis]|uniref:Uncharacterized protein n=1 Tax=Arthrobacter livingstonensis TaxID=670078 RepID=A0A2V5LMN6_9MICC|nr:hypothetical protein CVV68_03725 [Arthrobacter livingstonensis]
MRTGEQNDEYLRASNHDGTAQLDPVIEPQHPPFYATAIRTHVIQHNGHPKISYREISDHQSREDGST